MTASGPLTVKKLDLYVLRTFIPLLLGSTAVAWFILVMQLLWRFVGDIVGKGVDTWVLLKLMFYSAMTVAPMALVLGVLLAGLMTFGNLSERMELLSMKTAGIPFTRIMRPLLGLSILLAGGLYWFQNDWMITSQVRFWQYYFSIKNKSPELAIPEGSFTQDIPGYSIYITRKDPKTKTLYDLMIYDHSEGPQNATIVLADSGYLYSVNDGQEMVLEAYHGESFRNLRPSQSSSYGGNVQRPFLREQFSSKEVIMHFDDSLYMVDEGALSSQFVGKNARQLRAYVDSLTVVRDSMAQVNRELIRATAARPVMQSDARSLSRSSREALLEEVAPVAGVAPGAAVGGAVGHAVAKKSAEEEGAPAPTRRDLDADLRALGYSQLQTIYNAATQKLNADVSSYYFNNMDQEETESLIRKNDFEFWRKYTYPVAVIVFFLIGAPLGALIRKGGIGVPFIVAIFCFIVFYILETTGVKMVNESRWILWSGIWLPNMVLFPAGLLLTYLVTQDSMRFNVDILVNSFHHFMGIEPVRKVGAVVAEGVPDYALATRDIDRADELADRFIHQSSAGYFGFFTRPTQQHLQRELATALDEIVDNLGRGEDILLVHRLSGYPDLMELANVRKPRERWLRIALMILFPIGLLVYAYYQIRYIAFRRECKHVRDNNNKVRDEIARITEHRKSH